MDSVKVQTGAHPKHVDHVHRQLGPPHAAQWRRRRVGGCGSALRGWVGLRGCRSERRRCLRWRDRRLTGWSAVLIGPESEYGSVSHGMTADAPRANSSVCMGHCDLVRGREMVAARRNS